MRQPETLAAAVDGDTGDGDEQGPGDPEAASAGPLQMPAAASQQIVEQERRPESPERQRQVPLVALEGGVMHRPPRDLLANRLGPPVARRDRDQGVEQVARRLHDVLRGAQGRRVAPGRVGGDRGARAIDAQREDVPRQQHQDGRQHDRHRRPELLPGALRDDKPKPVQRHEEGVRPGGVMCQDPAGQAGERHHDTAGIAASQSGGVERHAGEHEKRGAELGPGERRVLRHER